MAKSLAGSLRAVVLLRAAVIAAVITAMAGIGLTGSALAAISVPASVVGVVGAPITPVPTIDVSALTAPVTWAESPALPAGLTLDTGNGATAGVISGTPTSARPTTIVTITATDASAPPVSLVVDVSIVIDGTMTVPALSAVAGRPLPGTPTIVTKGLTSPITFSAPTAPEWLSIAPDGVIAGTPDATLTTTQIPVTATDALGAKASGSLTLTVTPGLLPAEQTVEARVGWVLTKKTAAFPAKPGHHFAITPSINALTGLDFDTVTGVVSGTATHPLAPTGFIVDQIPDAGGPSVATATITATVIGAMASGTQTVLGNVGSPLIPFAGCGTAAASAAGLVGRISFDTAPALPGASTPGDLAMDPRSGVLAGQARNATPGTKYTVIATDASGASATCDLMIAINGTLDPPTQILNANTSTLTSSTPPTPMGMAVPVTYSVTPTLPVGLNVNADTGAVSGIAHTTRITAVFTIVATDRNGATAASILTISVGRPLLTPPVITAVLPGQDEGTLQVFFTPPAFAPGVQTYTVLVYSAKDLELVGREDALRSPVAVGELEPGMTYQVVVVANATAFFDRVESTPKSGTAARFTAASPASVAGTARPVSATTVAQRPNVAALIRAGIRLAPTGVAVKRVALANAPVTALTSASTVPIPKNRYIVISVPGVQSTEQLLVSVKVGGAWLTLGAAQASRALVLTLPAVSFSSRGTYPIRISGDHTRSLYVKAHVS